MLKLYRWREKISGEQLFRMTFSDGGENDHIMSSKWDEVAWHRLWCAGCNLNRTLLTQPHSSQMLRVQRKLGTKQGTDGECSGKLWLSHRSTGSPCTLHPVNKVGDEERAGFSELMLRPNNSGMRLVTLYPVLCSDKVLGAKWEC